MQQHVLAQTASLMWPRWQKQRKKVEKQPQTFLTQNQDQFHEMLLLLIYWPIVSLMCDLRGSVTAKVKLDRNSLRRFGHEIKTGSTKQAYHEMFLTLVYYIALCSPWVSLLLAMWLRSLEQPRKVGTLIYSSFAFMYLLIRKSARAGLL